MCSTRSTRAGARTRIKNSAGVSQLFNNTRGIFRVFRRRNHQQICQIHARPGSNTFNQRQTHGKRNIFTRHCSVGRLRAFFFPFFLRKRNIPLITFHYASLRVVVANREFEDSVRVLVARIRVRRALSLEIFCSVVELNGTVMSIALHLSRDTGHNYVRLFFPRPLLRDHNISVSAELFTIYPALCRHARVFTDFYQFSNR